MDTPQSLSSQRAVQLNDNAARDKYARAERESAFLARLLALVTSNLPFHELCSQVLGLLAQRMPAGRMAVVEFNLSEQGAVAVYPQAAIDAETLDTFWQVAQRVAQPDAPSQTALTRQRPFLVAPLSAQGVVTGALILEPQSPEHCFTSEDEHFLQTVALQLALVIERERALEQARRRTDQMAAFSAVTSTVNEWVDAEQLARRFLAVFLNTTGTQYGLFYLLEGEEHLRLLAQFGIPTELHESFRMGHVSLHPDLLRVISRGQMVVTDEAPRADGSARANDLAPLVAVSSVAILPLRVKGRGIGAVALGTNQGQINIADREFVQGLADQAAQAIENARLFAESQRRFEEQSALRELAQRFLSAVSPDQVIERTLDTLAGLLPGDFYEILLPDNDGAFVLVNGRGWRRGVVGRTRIVSDPHLHAGYVLRAQSPVIIENFMYETRFQPSDYLLRHQVVAGVCAPMLAETRVIGLLGVYSRAPRQFSEEQSHFLYLVATQTAMALEKARHSQAAQRRLDELILLNDVIGAANSEVSLDCVLQNVTGEIGELLQSDDVQVYFARENGDGAELHAALAWRAPSQEAPWARAVADWVVRNGQALLIPDLSRDIRFSALAQGARTLLAVPMTIRERVIGVIEVTHAEPNAFANNDPRLLTTLAGPIAAAIERARLLDETATRLAEISAMFEFSNGLRTAASEGDLVELVVRDAVTILQGVGGSLQLATPGKDVLQVVAVHNMKHRGALFPRRLGGLSWDVYQTGESTAIADVRNEPRLRNREIFERMHGGIVVPLRTPSGVLGTLFVGFAAVGEPSQAKLRIATTIANLAAQALQRLRLNEQTEDQAQSLAGALDDLETSYQATLLALSAALDARDRETEGHSQRVTKWANAIGQQLQLSPEELTDLERGALLHDVGKIGISDNILLKAGPLTPEERELMNQHPKMGYEMLKGIPFLKNALAVVLHHQEMYDGSGYPAGLRGEQIPLGARIFAVADTYDAMTSMRPYRKALSHQQALREIVRCRGTQFDPRVVDAFVALFENKHKPR